MKLSPAQYAESLYSAVQETDPKDHGKVLDNFVKILAQNGDLEKHPEIEAEYHRLEMKASGVNDVNITFAQEHSTNILDDLNKVVRGKAEFKIKIDQGIIGGVVVRVDDTLIDASVKTQLSNLNQSLKNQ